MKLALVSGIWPPDVGGPASHAPEVAGFLQARGHDVTVVVTADRTDRGTEPYPVQRVTRRLPKGVIHAATLAAIARAARGRDVIYSTGMFTRTAAAAAIARTPFVVKLTGDPAFERARWRGRVSGGVDAFQRDGGGVDVAMMRAARDWSLRRAAHIVVPSEYLRSLAVAWGAAPDCVSVLPNPAPSVSGLPSRDELRRELGFEGPTLAFAGRFGPQKSLDVALAAVARTDGVTLALVGDGDGRAELEAASVRSARFLGRLPRRRVLEVFRAADAALLSSSWENFPHSVVEALAVGTPVIATAVGGVPEVVEDGVNGLLVPPGDPVALAAAIDRFFADDALRARLRGAAAASVERYGAETVYGELERILLAAAG
jgi:glycosyltransferase involved in cell wall biosynthesis